MACHSIGEDTSKLGGTFAANLSRVGEKANYDYIVRWIYNPRERYAPYCPKEKRDLTPEDYAKHNRPYLFDNELHSTCPNDGAELQVQNMTVMPNLRLSEQDSRDIATYLFSLSAPQASEDVSYMDDPKLAEEGKAEIKQYGCAGCHEIKGFEEEQRIGKELTTEGSTPLERLDFALLTQDAEYGREVLKDADGKTVKLHPKEKEKEWYNHRGFFEHKLAEPGIYDRGKSEYLDPKERLRMPKPYLTDEWRTNLTTLLLGSRGPEGKCADVAFRQSAGFAAPGHSKRLVGSQEIQLHGLSCAAARAEHQRLQQRTRSNYHEWHGAECVAVLRDSERVSAADADQRGRARRSGLVDEVPEGSFVDERGREGANTFVSFVGSGCCFAGSECFAIVESAARNGGRQRSKQWPALATVGRQS
jgi:hypothetical protein